MQSLIKVERHTSVYFIRVFKPRLLFTGYKQIDKFVYNTAEDVACWLRCLPQMGYSKKITESGRRYFRKVFAYKFDGWNQADKREGRVLTWKTG